MDNLSPKDLKGLKLLANAYREYTNEEIDLAIKKNTLMEVKYEKL
jgi:hypothetical protein